MGQVLGRRAAHERRHLARLAAQGLAAAQRIEEAERSLAAAHAELEHYRDEYATSTVLVAEAVVRHARGDDPVLVADVFGEAVRVANAQGARAMARRALREARRLGITIG